MLKSPVMEMLEDLGISYTHDPIRPVFMLEGTRIKLVRTVFTDNKWHVLNRDTMSTIATCPTIFDLQDWLINEFEKYRDQA